MNKLKVLINTKITYAVIVIISIIVMTFSFTINEKMHESTKGDIANLSNYFGAVITNMKFERTGYLGYKDVRNVIKDAGTFDNNVLDKAMAVTNPSTKDIYTMASLDTGFIDYCRLAFYLFGIKVSSLLFLYFSIFCISILLFFIEFIKLPLANIILILYMVAHYVAITAIPYLDHNVGVIYNPRLLPMLGILPLIHICLSVRQKSHSIFAFIAILLQSLIIIMVNHMRSPAIWMILFVLTFLLFNVLSYLYKSIFETKELNLITTLKNNFKIRLFTKSWQLTPVLIMFLVYKIFFPFTLDPAYAVRGEGSHFSSMWSVIFEGFALHPEIRENFVGERKINENVLYDKICSAEHFQKGATLKSALRMWLCNNPVLSKWLIKIYFNYKYEANDQDCYSAVFNWLHKNGMNEYQIFNFNTDERVNYMSSFTWFNTNRSKSLINGSEIELDTYREFDWDDDFNNGEHNKVHYNIVLDVVRTHPLQVLKVIFVIKPLQYIVMYANSFFPRILGFPAIVMFCFVVFSIYVGKSISRDAIKHALIFFSLMILISVSPLIITFPGRHLMFDQVILIHMLIYFLLIAFFRHVYLKYIIRGKVVKQPLNA